MINKHTNSGFTLIEIAIVLLIVTIILGYTVALFPIQQELKQYRKADKQMDQIIEAIYAYAQVNGRLPCADSIAAPDGIANPDNGTDCTVWYGLLPAKTLGIDGQYDDNQSLLDPWGTPYRYQVTSNDDDGDFLGDFVGNNEMNGVGIANLTPDLEICTVNPSNNPADNDCGLANVTVAERIPAVVLSLGKDGGRVLSNIQVENTDNTADGVTDIVFVKTTRNDAAGTEFDDIVKWVAPNLLYAKMIASGQIVP